MLAGFLLWCLKKRKDKKLADARDADFYETLTGHRAKYKAQVQLKLAQMKRAEQWPGQEENKDPEPPQKGFMAKGEIDPWAFEHWKARHPPQAHYATHSREFV